MTADTNSKKATAGSVGPRGPSAAIESPDTRGATMGWADRGFEDGLNGREPRPAKNKISRDDYMVGYRAGASRKSSGK